MTREERQRQARITQLAERLDDDRSDAVRLDERVAAQRLHTINELGRFDAGQFAAVNR